MSTEMKQEGRQVDRERLQSLGFSQNVISSIERMNQFGFFEVQPPDDLVQGIIEKCIPLLPDPQSLADPEPSVPVPYPSVLKELSIEAQASSEWGEFSGMQDWQQACFTTLGYAQSTRERPFIMLDNHNVIVPAWWGSDTGFRAFWNASQVVNRIVAKDGIPRAACFVVLRPELKDYSDDDIETIDEMVSTGSSDVWWIPYDRAGAYQRRDLIVLGEERVFELKGKPQSPVAAMKSFREKTEQEEARVLRGEVRLLETLGKIIRVEGRLSKEAAGSVGSRVGIRHLMQSVMSG